MSCKLYHGPTAPYAGLVQHLHSGTACLALSPVPAQQRRAGHAAWPRPGGTGKRVAMLPTALLPTPCGRTVVSGGATSEKGAWQRWTSITCVHGAPESGSLGCPPSWCEQREAGAQPALWIWPVCPPRPAPAPSSPHLCFVRRAVLCQSLPWAKAPLQFQWSPPSGPHDCPRDPVGTGSCPTGSPVEALDPAPPAVLRLARLGAARLSA